MKLPLVAVLLLVADVLIADNSPPAKHDNITLGSKPGVLNREKGSEENHKNLLPLATSILHMGNKKNYKSFVGLPAPLFLKGDRRTYKSFLYEPASIFTKQ
ncbi:hypothetical protein Y032_0518g2826 [Ancylostoma ceylanicum]|uniref:Uncharacterized protein n=1 Tax=Ancylostoma ceylanicum TaxID=53326 RepID=A0A016WT60_9BILA|nr:hypothetical protein Y032_0518g2826 [Ancylostoma ceylanicum]